MSVLPIVIFDDEVLHKEAAPVTKNTPQLQQLIDDMFDTMYNADGVGLAAPQIGKLLRLFVADADVYAEEDEDEPSHGPIVMINPKIKAQSAESITMEEGCLSIPDVMGPVSRAKGIKVVYKDREFCRQEMQVNSHLARVIQHEKDHLDGVLFLDHLSYFKRKLVASKLSALSNGEKEIDYPVVEKVNL